MAKEDVVVCKWKDKRDVHTISNAHTPQIVTFTTCLGKEKQKSNIVRDYKDSMSGIDRSDQILSYHSGPRKTLRWYKKAGVHIYEIFITNAFYLYRKFSSHLQLCHLVEFCEVILKNLIWERKKKPINDTNGQLPLPTNHFWQWKEEETKKTLPAILEERNKKRITICLWILSWSTTPLHWPMFPIVTQRLRNTARFAKMKYITTYYN